jgi:hypothetical protein
MGRSTPSNSIGLERHLLRALGRDAIKEYVQPCNEVSLDSCVLVDEPEFNRLGLTDIAIGLASSPPAFVLTADLPLDVHLSAVGVEVENFTHTRQDSWSK